MELHIFARFHARPGNEAALADSLRAVVAPTRDEPGCLSINAFRSTRDPQLYFIHSRWTDVAALERHAELSHTVHFIERVQLLVDQPLDIQRTEQIV